MTNVRTSEAIPFQGFIGNRLFSLSGQLRMFSAPRRSRALPVSLDNIYYSCLGNKIIFIRLAPPHREPAPNPKLGGGL
jgi:hypothetical protein